MNTITVPIRCANFSQIKDITVKLEVAAQKMKEVQATLEELTKPGAEFTLDIEV